MLFNIIFVNSHFIYIILECVQKVEDKILPYTVNYFLLNLFPLKKMLRHLHMHLADVVIHINLQ